MLPKGPGPGAQGSLSSLETAPRRDVQRPPPSGTGEADVLSSGRVPTVRGVRETRPRGHGRVRGDAGALGWSQNGAGAPGAAQEARPSGPGRGAAQQPPTSVPARTPPLWGPGRHTSVPGGWGARSQLILSPDLPRHLCTRPGRSEGPVLGCLTGERKTSSCNSGACRPFPRRAHLGAPLPIGNEGLFGPKSRLWGSNLGPGHPFRLPWGPPAANLSLGLRAPLGSAQRGRGLLWPQTPVPAAFSPQLPTALPRTPWRGRAERARRQKSPRTES